MTRRRLLLGGFAVVVAGAVVLMARFGVSPARVLSAIRTPREPDVIFVTTPPAVVKAMLEVAHVGPHDLVIDLGSGDGRIPIAAARDYGARAIGVEIDPELVAKGRDNAREAGVADRVEFRQEDLFKTDISQATVVTLYLLPTINLKLRSRLLNELKPGSRVVSHAFHMGDWQPDEQVEVESRRVYLWVIPPDAKGRQ